MLETYDMLITEARAIFDEKSRAYGTDNIAQSGLVGVLTRASDKLARAKNLARGADSGSEPLRDTLLDLTNYAIIALMVATGKWPGTEAGTEAGTDQPPDQSVAMFVSESDLDMGKPQVYGDVGYDLPVLHDIDLPPGGPHRVRTGIRVKAPPGVWFMIIGRSSAWAKRGLQIVPGVIDNGYTGELEVVCFSSRQVQLARGERIGQIVFMPSVIPTLERVTKLPRTSRGGNGFGSTG